MPTGSPCSGGQIPALGCDSFFISPFCDWDSILCQPPNCICSPLHTYPVSSAAFANAADSVTDIGILAGTTYTTGTYGGFESWINASDAATEDGNYAFCTTHFNRASNWLLATGFHLGIPSGSTIVGIRPAFKVTSGAVKVGSTCYHCYLYDWLLTTGGVYYTFSPPGPVAQADDGMSVRYMGNVTLFGCVNETACTVSPGVVDSTNWWHITCDDINFDDPDPVFPSESFNPAAQLWGRAWTVDEVNADSFGVGLQIGNNLIGAAGEPADLVGSVDCFGVAVYYIPAGAPPTSTPMFVFAVSK